MQHTDKEDVKCVTISNFDSDEVKKGTKKILLQKSMETMTICSNDRGSEPGKEKQRDEKRHRHRQRARQRERGNFDYSSMTRLSYFKYHSSVCRSPAVGYYFLWQIQNFHLSF